MLEKVRKIGIISKGTIYSLIGLLTFLAALDLGGEVSGKNEVFRFLKNQYFGKFILIAVAIGLLLYSFWRFYTVFSDLKKSKNDKKKALKKIGYFFSGLVYGALAVSIILGSGSSGNTKQQIAQDFMQNTLGVIALSITALALLGTGIYQFYKGYSLKFTDEIQHSGSKKSKEVLKKTGKYGHMARGVAFGIFAYFLAKAVWEKNASAIEGVEGMFRFLSELTLGNILMATLALGFVLYGVFQFFLAKYSKI